MIKCTDTKKSLKKRTNLEKRWKSWRNRENTDIYFKYFFWTGNNKFRQPDFWILFNTFWNFKIFGLFSIHPLPFFISFQFDKIFSNLLWFVFEFLLFSTLGWIYDECLSQDLGFLHFEGNHLNSQNPATFIFKTLHFWLKFINVWNFKFSASWTPNLYFLKYKHFICNCISKNSYKL